MKFQLALLLTLTLLPAARAEDARFFRIAGPVATTITTFSADGYVTWTNAPTSATFTVQTAASLVGPSNWVDYIQVPATNAATTHRLYDPNPPAGMTLIPAGTFTMGDTFNDWPPEWGANYEIPTHTVYVSAFYMDKYEVTKALWDDVYQWATNQGYSFEYGALGKTNNHPVHSMTWYDAAKWCNARSAKEGRVPAYYTDASWATLYKTGQLNLTNGCVKWSDNGYRLPTEAEWEKAARGGASGHRFPWADSDTISWSRANYYAYPLSAGGYAYDVNPTPGYHPTFAVGGYPYTSPVGYFAANGYGLFDMAGNVREWCWDWDGAYASGSQTDPRGPSSGSLRVNRGGSWSYYAIRGCRAAYRGDHGIPTGRNNSLGFRSVLPSGQ